jgi:hypothetical protein
MGVVVKFSIRKGMARDALITTVMAGDSDCLLNSIVTIIVFDVTAFFTRIAISLRFRVRLTTPEKDQPISVGLNRIKPESSK